MKKNIKKQICYFCGNLASTKEHVPPKALFPTKEYNGTWLKNNLITVPSCEEHNSTKSADDEYFCNIMKTSIDSNKIPEKTMLDSLYRSVYRNPNLYHELFKNESSISVWHSSSMQKTVSYDVDLPRFNNVLEHITKALYFYEKKEISPYKYIGSNFVSASNNLDVCTINLLKCLEYKGANQKVFKYNILIEKEKYYLFMWFYEGNLIITCSEK